MAKELSIRDMTRILVTNRLAFGERTIIQKQMLAQGSETTTEIKKMMQLGAEMMHARQELLISETRLALNMDIPIEMLLFLENGLATIDEYRKFGADWCAMTSVGYAWYLQSLLEI